MANIFIHSNIYTLYLVNHMNINRAKRCILTIKDSIDKLIFFY